ncbi:PREDICTED: myosin-IIIb-like, partial [Leptosomus discolor]
GESGAGKTESTKLLLQHIMNLCKGNSQLEQQILQVNPLLEAFGNAQTVMNDNSSRFGKYIQLRFQNNTVQGAKLSEYLLEKSRVVHQDTDERNFHIFYYMLAGLSSEEKEMYGLLDPSLYRYISGRFGTQDVAQHWKHKYQEVCNALDIVGFQEQEQVDMQAILAGVLSLGNVTFEPEESNESVKVSEASQGWLKAAASQFGVQEDEMLKCLVCTVLVTRGEQIQRFHTQQQAEDTRDSIAKMAYGRVFSWIVCKINQLLAKNMDPEVELREIGILDIFGFENFAVNRFEQLCINLANEQLQHFFNHLEQAAYKEELPWETITFNNNEPILNLFLAKPLGLLSLLDEQSAFPQATDKTFVDKLNSRFKENLHFQPGRGRVLGFSIIHYAGKVQYTAEGFLEKNRDTFPASVRELFINSVTPLLSVLFTATVSRTGTLMPHMKAKVTPGADKFNSTRNQSAGAQFRHSLTALMERIYSAKPHFVRCIKPNSQKEPGVVDNQVVLQQLRYNGLLETIRIRRDGFSWRPSFEEFAERSKDCCRHYMIQMQPSTQYVILGEDRAHASLTELVRYHQTVGIQPFMETLTLPCEQKSSESLDYKDLSLPAAKQERPPEEQPCPSRPSASRPALQSGAAEVLRYVRFKSTKSCRNQQSLDKSKTTPSSGKERGSQQALPRHHSFIRLAMKEIQQFSSVPLNTSVQSRCRDISTDDVKSK